MMNLETNKIQSKLNTTIRLIYFIYELGLIKKTLIKSVFYYINIVFPLHLLQLQLLLLLPKLIKLSNNSNKIDVLLARSILVADAITDNIITSITAHSVLIAYKPPKYNILPPNNLLCDNIFNCYIK